MNDNERIDRTRPGTFIGPLNRNQIVFGGEAVTPYRMGGDSLGELATRTALELIAETINDATVELRIVEYSAMLDHFEKAAEANGGSVPIEEVRALLRDMLEAKK